MTSSTPQRLHLEHIHKPTFIILDRNGYIARNHALLAVERKHGIRRCIALDAPARPEVQRGLLARLAVVEVRVGREVLILLLLGVGCLDAGETHCLDAGVALVTAWAGLSGWLEGGCEVATEEGLANK